MFLHVGADVVVSLKRVIAILDLRSSLNAESTREFLKLVQSKRRVTDIANGDAKSMVLTDADIYLSPISSLTLMKRANFLDSNASLDLGISTSQ